MLSIQNRTSIETVAEMSRLGAMVTETNPLSRPARKTSANAKSVKLLMPIQTDKLKEIRHATGVVSYPIFANGATKLIHTDAISVYEEDGHIVFVVQEGCGKQDGVDVPGGQYVMAMALIAKFLATPKFSEEYTEFLKTYASDAEVARIMRGGAASGAKKKSAAPAAIKTKAALATEEAVEKREPTAESKRSDSRCPSSPGLTSNVPFGQALGQLKFKTLRVPADYDKRALAAMRMANDFVPFLSTADEFYVFEDCDENNVLRLVNQAYMEDKERHPDRVPILGIPPTKGKSAAHY